MLSVIIPTDGVEHPAVVTLAALVPGVTAGLVSEVILVDRADNGVIDQVADIAGCRFLRFDGSRAAALAAGARQARAPWLMFLRAGAVIDSTWIEEAAQFIERVSRSGRPRAGVFRCARASDAEPPLRAGLARIAQRLLTGSPADLGLLIAREHYDRLGGHGDHGADDRRAEARLMRQLGRSSRTLLRSRIIMV